MNKSSVPKVSKQFIIRKYIMASSAKEAIKKDKDSQVDDVWVDEDWKELNRDIIKEQIGFQKKP